MDERRGRRWAVLGSAIVVALALTACGDDDEGPIPQTGVRETTTTSEASSTTAAESTTTTAAGSTTTTASASTTTTTAASG